MFIEGLLAPLLAIPMAIAEIVAAIAALFIELLIHLIAWMMTAGWLSATSRGHIRAAWALAALTALYLLATLTSPFWASEALMLSPLFSWPVIVAAGLLLVFFIAVPAATERVVAREAGEAPDATRKPGGHGLTLMASYGLAIALVIGGLSTWSTGRERVTLKEKATQRLCAEVDARVSDEMKDTGARLRDLGERLLNRDLNVALPCTSVEEASR